MNDTTSTAQTTDDRCGRTHPHDSWSVSGRLDGRLMAPPRFDAAATPCFIDEILASSGHLIVDCSSVEFLDVSAYRALRAAVMAGRVTVVDPSIAVLLTLDIVGPFGRPSLGLAA